MEYQGEKLRHEFKYYINYSTYEIIKNRLKDVLALDNGESYVVSSLYFDDMYNSAMIEKINGTRFRKKYRIRIYNHSDGTIKLECKKKYDSYTAKTSALLTREEYNSILEDDYDSIGKKDNILCQELYAMHKTKLLRPVTVVEYLREAYVATEGNVRITFDQNISASITTLDMFCKEYVTSEVLPFGTMVMEVKYDDFIPKHILSMLQLATSQKCAISKYVMCRNRNRKVKMI